MDDPKVVSRDEWLVARPGSSRATRPGAVHALCLRCRSITTLTALRSAGVHRSRSMMGRCDRRRFPGGRALVRGLGLPRIAEDSKERRPDLRTACNQNPAVILRWGRQAVSGLRQLVPTRNPVSAQPHRVLRVGVQRGQPRIDSGPTREAAV